MSLQNYNSYSRYEYYFTFMGLGRAGFVEHRVIGVISGGKLTEFEDRDRILAP